MATVVLFKKPLKRQRQDATRSLPGSLSEASAFSFKTGTENQDPDTSIKKRRSLSRKAAEALLSSAAAPQRERFFIAGKIYVPRNTIIGTRCFIVSSVRPDSISVRTMSTMGWSPFYTRCSLDPLTETADIVFDFVMLKICASDCLITDHVPGDQYPPPIFGMLKLAGLRQRLTTMQPEPGLLELTSKQRNTWASVVQDVRKGYNKVCIVSLMHSVTHRLDNFRQSIIDFGRLLERAETMVHESNNDERCIQEIMAWIQEHYTNNKKHGHSSTMYKVWDPPTRSSSYCLVYKDFEIPGKGSIVAPALKKNHTMAIVQGSATDLIDPIADMVHTTLLLFSSDDLIKMHMQPSIVQQFAFLLNKFSMSIITFDSILAKNL